MTPLTKQRYTVTEASKLVGVSPPTLYRWEKQFSQLRPKVINGWRRYSPEDIRLCSTIRELLYTKGLTTASASEYLSQAYRIHSPRNKFICGDSRKALELISEAIAMAGDNAHIAERLKAVRDWMEDPESAAPP